VNPRDTVAVMEFYETCSRELQEVAVRYFGKSQLGKRAVLNLLVAVVSRAWSYDRQCMNASEWVSRVAEAEARRLREAPDAATARAGVQGWQCEPSRSAQTSSRPLASPREVKLVQEPLDAFVWSGNRAQYQIAVRHGRFQLLRNCHLASAPCILPVVCLPSTTGSAFRSLAMRGSNWIS